MEDFETTLKVTADPKDRVRGIEGQVVRGFRIRFGENPQADAAAVGDALAARLLERTPGAVTRLQGGRVLDDRTWPRTDTPSSACRPPNQHLLLVPRPNATLSHFQPPQAVVVDGDKPARKLDDSPLLVAEPLGEGQVIVFGYSPFSEDAWQNDTATSVWPYERTVGDPEVARDRYFQGWGPQRLIDSLALTSLQPPTKNRTSIRAVKTFRDGATVELTCAVNLAEGVPELELVPPQPTVERHRFDLVELDPAARTAVYRFVAGSSWRPTKGDCVVRLSDSTGNPLPLGTVYLDLAPRQSGGEDVAAVLEGLTRLTDGAVIEDGAAPSLRFTRPTRWVASFGFLALTGVILSPIVRRWRSLARFFRRRRMRRNEQAAAQGGLDVPTLVSEWGVNPGPPRTGRQAGLPGGERIFQAGDTLSRAKAAGLVPFTAAGRAVALPPRLPTVRLRHLGAAIEGTVLLDCSASMKVPSWSLFGPPKEEYARQLISFIAGFIWSRGGTLRLGALHAPAALTEPFGPGSDTELEQAVRNLQQAGSNQGDKAGTEAGEVGSVCFIVADLVGPDEDHLGKLVTHLTQDGVSVRVAALLDPEELELTGLVWNASDGLLQDRSEWEEGDLRRGYSLRGASYRHAVEQGEGRIVLVTTDLDTAGVSEAMKDADFLA